MIFSKLLELSGGVASEELESDWFSVAMLELDSWFSALLSGGATLLELLGSSAPFAEVVSLSQLAQKNPVSARAIFFQCL
jgi:hypothetical protein